MRSRALAVAVAVAVVVAVGAACDAAEPSGTGNDLERLCQALAVGTTEEIRTLFEGPTHQALHDLADDLQSADRRPVAGDVLETKQAVEAALATDAGVDDLHAALDGLVDAVDRGLRVLDKTPLTCAD